MKNNNISKIKRKKINSTLYLKKIIVGMLAVIMLMVNFNVTKNVLADGPEYFIRINRVEHCVTVYKMDSNGQYSKAVKSMVCGTGVSDELTPLGAYSILKTEQWGVINGNRFAQYSIDIGNGLKIRTASYVAREKNMLSVVEYNTIGENGTDGSILLTYIDAKWIAENCIAGTGIEIYDEIGKPGKLGRPNTLKLPLDNPDSVWDPTDDDAMNPWKTKQPVITGAKGIVTSESKEVDLLKGVKAKDICGNDITEEIVIMGEYNFDKHGKYTITYMVEDASGAMVTKDVELAVNPGKEEKTTKRTASVSTSKSETTIANAQGKDKNNSQSKDSENGKEKSFREKVVILLGLGFVAFIISVLIIRYAKK